MDNNKVRNIKKRVLKAVQRYEEKKADEIPVVQNGHGLVKQTSGNSTPEFAKKLTSQFTNLNLLSFILKAAQANHGHSKRKHDF